MRLLAKLLRVFVLLALPIVGCNEVTDAVRMTVLISEGLPPTPTAPIARGQLCQADTSNCDESGANGEATIELPRNERVIWTLEADGYGSTMTPYVTDSGSVWASWQLWTDEWYAENYDRLMADYPMTDKGAIYVFVMRRLAGVTFRLVDATGEGYYFDEEGNLSPDLQATTSLGAGRFVEVQPGEFQVEIGGREPCIPTWGWPGNTSNRITVPVKAGYMTTTVITCSGPPLGY